MPYSVLQPVKRKRRSRSRRPLLFLGFALLIGVGSLAATQPWAHARGQPSHSGEAAIKPSPVSQHALERLRAAAAEQEVAANAPFAPGTRLLLAAAPRLEQL